MIVGATIMSAPISPKNADKKRDLKNEPDLAGRLVVLA